LEDKYGRYGSDCSIVSFPQLTAEIKSNSKTTIRETESEGEDEKVFNNFSESGTTSKGSSQENEASEDSSEAGASVQFEISGKNDYVARIIADFIFRNQSKTVNIDVYNDENTIISKNKIDLLDQHQYDNFHLILPPERETHISNFRRDQFERNTLKISS
jgi:hypothetical protein